MLRFKTSSTRVPSRRWGRPLFALFAVLFSACVVAEPPSHPPFSGAADSTHNEQFLETEPTDLIGEPGLDDLVRPWNPASGQGALQPLRDLTPGQQFVFQDRVYDSRVTFEAGLEVRATDLVLAEVYKTYERYSENVYDLLIETAEGTEIITGTGEHPVWVEELQEFVPLADLEVGETLRTAEGRPARVAELHPHQQGSGVFNFAVRGAHNYFVQTPAGGSTSVLVHNECGPTWGTEVDLDEPGMSVREWGVDYSESASGNYDVEFASGNYYHGKGLPDRAEASAVRVAQERGDTIVSVTNTPQPNHRAAFKQEDRNIQASGGIGGDNYNKVNSPGRKMRMEDGD